MLALSLHVRKLRKSLKKISFSRRKVIFHEERICLSNGEKFIRKEEINMNGLTGREEIFQKEEQVKFLICHD